MRRDGPAEPWLSFLDDLDASLEDPVDLHCIGGFVVSQHFGLARETADLDVLTVIPPGAANRVAEVAGKASPLRIRHKVYIDHVTICSYPDSYQSRLIRVFPLWTKVRLWALEPHDLALTKLERSNDRDIRDVMFLAQAGLITRETLLQRFETELEPYLTGRTPTWNRSTLQMWISSCWPESR
jgi:hypothetical protein